jgi:alkaline phosphatase D
MMPRRAAPTALRAAGLLKGRGRRRVWRLVAAPAVLRHAAAQSWRAGDPFSLGRRLRRAAPDGFVLWTRLAPEPLSTDPETPGGMSGGDVTVAL